MYGPAFKNKDFLCTLFNPIFSRATRQMVEFIDSRIGIS